MSVIKDEFILVRFSRLLRDEEPFPTTNQIVDQDIALNINAFADIESRIYLNLELSSNDLVVTTTIQS
jgi:hypothetical protein